MPADTGLWSAAVCAAYLGVFLAAGWLAARRALPDASPAVLAPLGCAFGVSFLAALPALAALALGFTTAAVLAGGAAALALALGLRLAPGRPAPLRWSRQDSAAAACALPALALALWLLHTHVLYRQDGAYHTGQSCYGDLAMHLAYIKSIAVRGTFPPAEPLLAGDLALNYPFLCETVSSVFLLLGAGLRFACLLPLAPALLAVFGMAWQLARAVLESAARACLAFWLFFMGSGFGFVYFLGSPEAFASIFTGYYTTPTNYTEKNIVWVNPIVDLLVPQRATLLGWCVLFAALYLLWRFAMLEQARLWLPLAVLVLPLPLLQTHAALALVLCCLACGVYTLARCPHTRAVLLPWAALAGLCAAVWLPETLGTVVGHAVQGQNMLRLHFNWVNNQNGALQDNYFWFYAKNIGLVYVLLVPAFLHARARQRWFYGGGALIWALAECVVFQPNLYDNNKLLYIWHFLGCVLAAGLLGDWLARLRALPARAAALAAVCFAGMFGSALTVGRELVSDYVQWDAADIDLAAYVDEHAEADALFLTTDSHLQPVCSLAGRQILCGSGSFLYYHGMDYGDPYDAMCSLYARPDTVTLDAWGVDYAVFDAQALNDYAADESWYAAQYPLWYQNERYRVYKIG